MRLQEVHARHIGKSAILSEQQVERAIPLIDVLTVLNQAKIRFVLVGAHALSAWTKDPRATEDVDVVVAANQLKKATQALLLAFPHLQADDRDVVIRLKDKASGDVVIDVMKPRSLYRETFKHTHSVTTAGQQYRVPSLEMALTMKFAAMLSPLRQEEDKYQDAHDFIQMIKFNASIDISALSDLGELVYGGGGIRIVEIVEDVRAGRKLVL